MTQYMLYTLVASPLLLLGTPEWMARRITGKLRIYRVLRFLSRPLFAAIIVNVVLLATHAPIVVDNVRTTQMGGFALDMIWLAGGLVLWMPLISPLPELVHPSYPVRMIYLFVAAGVFAMIPGGFLTFSSFPLYRTYELAPRIHGFGALNDQQLAGAIMKIGNIPIVWTVIAVLFFRWATIDRDGPPCGARPTGRDAPPAPRHPNAPPEGGPPPPLPRPPPLRLPPDHAHRPSASRAQRQPSSSTTTARRSRAPARDAHHHWEISVGVPVKSGGSPNGSRHTRRGSRRSDYLPVKITGVYYVSGASR